MNGTGSPSAAEEPILHRREFLQHGALLAAALSGASFAGCGQPDRVQDSATKTSAAAVRGEIIDTHQHFWELSRFRLPWTDAETYLKADFPHETYAREAKRLGITRSIYMEVDVEPSEQVAEAEHLIELLNRGTSPLVAAIISGRPESAGFEAYIDRFRASPWVKGLRRVLLSEETSPDYFLSADFVDGIRSLGERGWSFDICVPAKHLGAAAKLCERSPDTSFVLDHCGNPALQDDDIGAWVSDIGRIAERGNCVCKVSGFIANARDPNWTVEQAARVIDRVFEVFGPERLVFGSDWPVCNTQASLERWLRTVEEIVRSRSEREQRQLFRDNAIRVYRLGAA
jgi:L-fuconolactonase